MSQRSAVPARQVDETTPLLHHSALFYRTPDEYLAEVLGFVETGLDNNEQVFVAVPGSRVDLIRDHLSGWPGRVTFADMTQLGVNPAWIIPRMWAFAGACAGRGVRYVGEPVWEARNAAELREITRHEALINLAFADTRIRILCAYDATALDTAVAGRAERTHPVLIRDGLPAASMCYDSAVIIPAECEQPLPAPPGDVAAITYRTALQQVRALVAEHGRKAGLGSDRAADLVIAVSELAANTLRHTDATGTLTVWTTRHEVICQVQDAGRITDPLIGRRCPPADSGKGHGLWVVHQLTDLVELRSGSDGTTIRLHMRIAR
jgi:anti-sigma regulatory factor (Ser/Thr protein kinase)